MELLHLIEQPGSCRIKRSILGQSLGGLVVERLLVKALIAFDAEAHMCAGFAFR